MDASDLAARRDLATLAVAHFMQQPDRLLDDIAGEQFALVGDVLLRGRGASAGAQLIARSAEKLLDEKA